MPFIKKQFSSFLHFFFLRFLSLVLLPAAGGVHTCRVSFTAMIFVI